MASIKDIADVIKTRPSKAYIEQMKKIQAMNVCLSTPKLKPTETTS